VSSGLALRGAIEQFYARQIQLLGDGEVDRWGETFTPDAVFEQDGRLNQDGTRGPRAVWRGRADIVSAAGQARRDSSVVRRYWVGMVTVSHNDDGSVRTGYYGALFNTDVAGVDLFRSTHGTDLLVRDGGEWLVAHRRIDHDDVGRS
jgi:3-phenylpropionate/cinnamic acid dioxygenase small subunit